MRAISRLLVLSLALLLLPAPAPGFPPVHEDDGLPRRTAGGGAARRAADAPRSIRQLPPPAPATAATQPLTPTRQVLAYYRWWDSASWESLTQGADTIDYVGAPWLRMDPCGGLSSRDDQTLKQFATERGIKVLPSLGTWSAWLNHRILADEAISANAISQIVDYVLAEGYPGFDLDLEGVDPGDRSAYSAFVARLAAALHAHGKILTLAIPAKTRDVTSGWAGAYDYAALGHHADLITIMSYEYHGPWGDPGSIAPYDWVEAVAAFATSQIPPARVMLGLAFYGYDWNTTTGFPVRSLKYSQAQWLSDRFGVALAQDPASRSATMTYSAPWGDPAPPNPQQELEHTITTRTPPPCSVTPPTPPPGPTPTPRPTPPPDALQQHVVWIEDGPSAAARLALADRYATAGVSGWSLGQEDPTVWSIFRLWRSGSEDPPPDSHRQHLPLLLRP